MRLELRFPRRHEPKVLAERQVGSMSASQDHISIGLGTDEATERRYALDLTRPEALALAKDVLGYVMETELPDSERAFTWQRDEPSDAGLALDHLMDDIDAWFALYGGRGQFGKARP